MILALEELCMPSCAELKRRLVVRSANENTWEALGIGCTIRDSGKKSNKRKPQVDRKSKEHREVQLLEFRK